MKRIVLVLVMVMLWTGVVFAAEHGHRHGPPHGHRWGYPGIVIIPSIPLPIPYGYVTPTCFPGVPVMIPGQYVWNGWQNIWVPEHVECR